MPDPGHAPGEIPGWMYAIAGALSGALAFVFTTFGSVIAYLYRDNRAASKEHAKSLQDTVGAIVPTTDTLSKVTTAQAVMAERVEGLDGRVEHVEDRIAKTEERVERVEGRCDMHVPPRRSTR